MSTAARADPVFHPEATSIRSFGTRPPLDDGWYWYQHSREPKCQLLNCKTAFFIHKRSQFGHVGCDDLSIAVWSYFQSDRRPSP